MFEYSTELANSYPTSPYPFTSFGPQNYGVGYFSPEDCDDTAIMCTFKRFPSFGNLAAEYKAVNVSSEPSMIDFEPDQDRVKSTTCPLQFPPLRSFKWKSDSIKDLQCPAVGKLSCNGKNVLPSVLPDGSSPGSSGSGNNTARDTLHIITLALSTLGVISITPFFL